MPSSERKRVLILKNELPVALSLKSIVHDYGCEVIGPASSCPSAIDLLEANPVDAALLDLSVGE
jgi:DNA-binding NarL/FixJ family response regulator